MEMDFKRTVGNKWENKVTIGYAFQELSDLPSDFQVPIGREKPWGTAHAIYSARKAVQEPFAVLNADDFYGRQTFQVMADYLTSLSTLESTSYAMVGYRLANTLSEHGHVSRALCEADPNGKLRTILERLKIFKKGEGAEYEDPTGTRYPLSDNELVSMNIWGLTPAVFAQLGGLFVEFLKEKKGEETSEFLIPKAIGLLIAQKQAVVNILPTPDTWFGLTYPEDRKKATVSIGRLVSEGVYPENLWV
jgi:hypothetical protein